MKIITPQLLARLTQAGLILLFSTQVLPAQEPIRAKVEQVLVNVLVTNRNGRPIPNLKPEQFRVFENGVEQKINSVVAEDAPFSVGLVLDTSYSTIGKLGRIQDSAIEFLDEIHPDDEVLVVSFDDEVYLETEFTRNKDGAARAIKMTRTGQATVLYDAVYLALEQFKGQPFRMIMVLFTDGVDTRSRTGRGESIKFAREKNVTIYPIYFDTERDALYGNTSGQPLPTPGTIPGQGPVIIPGGNPLPFPSPTGGRRPNPGGVRAQYGQARGYLDQLAQASGGKRLNAEGDLSNLSAVFAQIAAEMRALYTLAYTPPNSNGDGKFRKIVVKVDEQGARVRNRKGYIAR